MWSGTRSNRMLTCSARSAVALARVDEDRRLGALERVDRLLDVADGEQRPRPLDRALAGEELVDQRIDRAPLLGIGVLQLVDEDVGDPGVELVAHPVAELAVLEQADRVLDEIVEVEQRAHALLGLVAIGDRAEHVEQRVGALDQLGAAQLAWQPEQPLGLALRRDRRGPGRAGALPCARGSWGPSAICVRKVSSRLRADG